MFLYQYFGLNRVWIVNIEDDLSRLGVTDISFSTAGSTVAGIAVRQIAGRANTTGVLLTVDELSKLSSVSHNFSQSIKEKIHSFSSEEELRDFIESEHELSLKAPEPVIEPAVEPVAQPEPVVEPAVESVIQPAPVAQPVVESVAQPEPVVEPVSVSSPSEGVAPSEDASIPLDGLSQLAYDHVLAERLALEKELDDLKLAYANLEREGASSKEVTSLKARVSELEESLESANRSVELYRSKMETTKERYDTLKDGYNDMQSTVEVQKKRILELESEVSSSVSAPAKNLSRIEVPYQIQFYTTASSLSLASSYQHLILNYPNAVLVDLCRESLLDTLIHITKQNRITKWLLEGLDVRAVYSPFEQIKLHPAKDLVVVSSPNTVLSEDLLSEIDWKARIRDLARLDRPVIVFLGLEDANGVYELIDRLNKPVKVLRGDNPVEERAWKRVQYKHEGNVEEVML